MGIEYGESTPTDLSVDAVCAAAAARTGLTTSAPTTSASGSELQLAEMDADEERTGLGRLLMFSDCTRYAANRLLIHDLLTRHPEILEIPIIRPVIVVGLPRSGTTHLVNLLAADTRFRSMPLWESYEPVPNPKEPSEVDGVDPRWTRCEGTWQAMQAAAPFVAAMHPMEPDHVHEEIELQTPDFSSYTHEWVARAPRWRDYYLEHDQTPHYAYMKTVLQIMQWYRPRERWVLKSPQHLEQLRPLLATFPDATIVVTHRDPVAVAQVGDDDDLLWRPHRRTARPAPTGTATTGRTESDGCSTHSSVTATPCPPIGPIDVLFHEYMADEIGTLERVYDCAGMELTDQARAEVAAYQTRPSPGKGRQGRLRPDGATSPSLPTSFGPASAPTSTASTSESRCSEYRRTGRPPDRHPWRQGAHAARPTTTRPSRSPMASSDRGDAPPPYLLLTDAGRVIVNTGLGFEAPHHKRLFDAVRRGPTHYIVTTQAHVDHVGGVDLFKETGHACMSPKRTTRPARPMTRASAPCACARRASGSTRWAPTPAASRRRTPASRCASLSRSPTSPSTSDSTCTSTACAWSWSLRWVRRSTVRSSGSPSAAPPS